MKNSDIESLVFIAPESDHAFIATSKKVRIKCVPTLLICIPQEQILLPTLKRNDRSLVQFNDKVGLINEILYQTALICESYKPFDNLQGELLKI